MFPIIVEKRKARMERKLKLKRQFDTDYDDGGEGKASFYEDLKKEVDQQANINRTEWDGMDDAQRVLYEGFRPGMYVRIEIKVTIPSLKHQCRQDHVKLSNSGLGQYLDGGPFRVLNVLKPTKEVDISSDFFS